MSDDIPIPSFLGNLSPTETKQHIEGLYRLLVRAYSPDRGAEYDRGFNQALLCERCGVTSCGMKEAEGRSCGCMDVLCPHGRNHMREGASVVFTDADGKPFPLRRATPAEILREHPPDPPFTKEDTVRARKALVKAGFSLVDPEPSLEDRIAALEARQVTPKLRRDVLTNLHEARVKFGEAWRSKQWPEIDDGISALQSAIEDLVRHLEDGGA